MIFVKKPLYRLEPGIRVPGQPTSFNLNSVIFKEFVNEDVQRVDPINALGGSSINGFPWLYSKIRFVNQGLNQEMYSLDTVLNIMNELNPPNVSVTNPFSSEYQAILTKATTLGYTLPSAAQQIKQNTLVNTLKSDGTWALLDVLYIFINDGSKEFATLNWINPSSNQVTLVASPTWSLNAGFSTDGISKYLNTNFNPAINGVNFVKNSACFFIQETSENNVLDLHGSIDGSSNGVFIRTRSNVNTSLFRINDGTNSAGLSNTSSIGLFSAVRTASNARALYKNASSLGSDAQSSVNIPSLNLFLGAYNNSGAPAFVTGNRTWASLGAGSGSIDQTKLYNAINAFTSNP